MQTNSWILCKEKQRKRKNCVSGNIFLGESLPSKSEFLSLFKGFLCQICSNTYPDSKHQLKKYLASNSLQRFSSFVKVARKYNSDPFNVNDVYKISNVLGFSQSYALILIYWFLGRLI